MATTFPARPASDRILPATSVYYARGAPPHPLISRRTYQYVLLWDAFLVVHRASFVRGVALELDDPTLSFRATASSISAALKVGLVVVFVCC